MTNELGILLGILILAYIFLTPLVLTVLVFKQRKRTRELEEDIEYLLGRLDRLGQGAAKGSGSSTEIEPQVEPGIPPAGIKSPVFIEEEHEEIEPIVPELPPRPAVPDFPPEQKVSISQVQPVFPKTVPREQETPSMVSRIPDFLKGIGMWPPSTESGHDRETVLMQWWLPRIGGLLALLSALFFGVYISQNTSPFFKCMELLAASLAIAGLGRFLERRYRTFGGIVLVTGLLMLYLTSVAAYILPATRIIGNPVTGSLVQAIVLFLICVIGLIRRSSGIVILAFLLGYVLGIFMAWEGLREGSLIATGLLFLAGAVLSRNPIFRYLKFIIIPGSFLVVLALPDMALIRTVEIPGNIPTQVYLNLVFAAITGIYFTGGMGKGRESRILLSVGSSLAILSVFWFYRTFYPDELEWAALVLGCNMLVGALIGWTMRGCGFLAQLLFVKAAFLIGVWAILHYAGDLRWMVLGLQTVVVSSAARRSRVLSMELAAWAVAATSFLYYLGSMDSVPVAGSFVWWMMTLYPAAIILALGFLLQPIDKAGVSLQLPSRKWAYACVPPIAVFLWAVLFSETPGRQFEMALPFVCVLYSAAALSRIPVFSGWMLLMTSALSFVMANASFCSEPFSIAILISLVVASIASVLWLVRKPGRWPELAENAVYALIITSVTLWMLQVLDDWKGQGLIMYLMGIGILLAGMIPKVRHVGSWAFLPLLVFMLTESAAHGAGMLNLAVYASGILWLAVPVLLPKVASGQGWARKGAHWSGIAAVLFWLYAVLFGDPEATWISGQVVLGSIALVLLLGAFRWPVYGYLLGALLYVVTVFLRHSLSMLNVMPNHPWKSEALISGGMLYAFALLWFFLRPIPFQFSNSRKSDLFCQASSGISAVLFFVTSVVTFQYRGLEWMNWYTPILAVTAFVMILLGLFRDDSVFRRLGLLALSIPLVRLFLVDVQDVLHRIIAFAAAAILLTFLGYLYNRIASRSAGKIPEGD